MAQQEKTYKRWTAKVNYVNNFNIIKFVVLNTKMNKVRNILRKILVNTVTGNNITPRLYVTT